MTRRSVIITGATGAIGSAAASAVAARGWTPILGHRSRAATLPVLEVLRREGSEALTVRLDLDDPESLESCLLELRAAASPCAVVLCASPPPVVASFTKTPREEFARAFSANVIGHHALLVALWKHFFRAAGGGHVVAVLTSALGPQVAPHMSSYVVAKAGLAALLQAALAEFGAAGLRASAVSPGYVETPMLNAFPAQLLELARRRERGGRFLAPEEVARVIADCLDSPPETPELHVRRVVQETS